MCTCIDFKTKDHYFGRTLDLEYKFGEKVVITPRNYKLKLKNNEELIIKNAIIGMATVVGNYPLYAEASNEKGLSMAGLNFPKNAYYKNPEQGKLNLALFELIPYFLGKYDSVKNLKEDLANLNITNQTFNENMPSGEMHFMICDEKDCLVIEQTKKGLSIYENKVRVMTNNPTFDYHLNNISNYINLTPKYPENTFNNNLTITPCGQGFGAIGLPGDTTPASRFIRAAFNKWNSICNEDNISSITQFFHILDSVSMVKGTTITKEGNYDLTTYSCCINTTKGIYYYKTYDNNRITAIKMTEENKTKNELTIYELNYNQDIDYIN